MLATIFFSTFQCRITCPCAASLLLCNIFSERKEFPPPSVDEWPFLHPPAPPAAPSHHEPAINIWKRTAGRQTTLCVRSSQREKERKRERERERLPNISNNAHNHFHVWPLAEIILATPFLPLKECQLFCRVISEDVVGLCQLGATPWRVGHRGR